MQIEWHDRVALLRLAAGKANAMGPSFIEQLGALLGGCEDAAALVLTGYEKFFCAGLDLPTLLALDRGGMRAFMERFTDLVMRLWGSPRPVVAAVNGHAIAGGCVLVQMADVRVMSRGGARIGLREAALGVGLPIGAIESIRHRIEPRAFQPVCLEGRLFDPEQALAQGLVDELVEPERLEALALERARALAAVPQAAFAHIKRSWRRPATQAIQGGRSADLDAWLETWFSEEARGLIAAAIAGMGQPSRR